MQKNHFIEIFFYWKRLIFHFRSLFRGANARPIFFQTSIFGAMGAFLSIHRFPSEGDIVRGDNC